jgi:hypothetical protein
VIEFLIFVAIAFSLPALVLGLLQLVAPQSSVHEKVRRRLSQFKLWQLVMAVVLCGLLFAMTSVREPIIPFMLAILVVLGMYVRTWRDEFLFLMGLRDDDFPGRNDKLIWVIVMLVFAPVGAWLFRSYRLSHWPRPERNPDPAPGAVGATVPSAF